MSSFSGFEMNDKPELWTPGWYSGAIVPQYETTGTFAKIIKTEDVPSASGDSRNLKLAVTLVNGNQTKNLSTTLNYRPEALGVDRMAELKQLKAGNAQLGGENFRDYMSLSRLNELEKAGLTVEVNGHGGFDTTKLIGSTADFYISIRKFLDESKKSKKKDADVTPAELKAATGTEGYFAKITQVAATGSKRK